MINSLLHVQRFKQLTVSYKSANYHCLRSIQQMLKLASLWLSAAHTGPKPKNSVAVLVIQWKDKEGLTTKTKLYV